MTLKLFLFVILYALLISPLGFSAEVDKDFPTPPSFVNRVEFWKKIYTEVDGNEGVIHDTEDFFVYEKIKIEHESARKKNKQITKAAKERISRLLLEMSSKDKEQFTPQEKELYERLGSPKAEDLRLRAEQIRFQKGQKDKYYQGLIRSQLYLDYIKREFKEAGLPERLAYLPHVESSFNYQAYSKVGAAGIWQFMRSTGRLYMRLNYLIDERRDPIIATRAAIKLLRSNYQRLGAWPLAVTAYNHGPESIARAIDKLNTHDIEVIIDDYKARKFKFASKNFYACFLAASEIAMHPEKYFKDIPSPKALSFAEIPLKGSFTVKEILDITKLSEKTFKDYNLSLRPVVYKKNSKLPVGFVVKIPSVNTPAISSLEEQVICVAKPVSPVAQATVPTLITPSPTPLLANTPVATPTPSPTPAPTAVAIQAAQTATPSIASNEPEEEIRIKTHYHLDLQSKGQGIYEATAQHSESLTMFSEWLEIPLKDLAVLNELKVSSDLELGQKIRLPIPKKQLADFKAKRKEYHDSVEEDFFDNYRITKMKSYKVVKGDTLADIANRFDIPIWLIIQVQKKELKNIHPKQILVLPEIQARKEQEVPVIPGSAIEEEEEIPEDYNPM